MDAEHVEHRRLQTSGSAPVVSSLLLSGDRIISASDDGLIRVFSFQKCALIYTLQGHTGGVWALDVLDDTLVSGSTDRTIRVWDLNVGICTHTLEGHTSTVRCIKIAKPGRNVHPVIVSGSRDSTLRIWGLPSREEDERKMRGSGFTDSDESLDVRSPSYLRFILEGHTSAVRGLDVHGPIAISGSYDYSVRVWDIEQGELIWNMEGHTQKVYCVVYDAIRKRAYSGSMDSTVRIWNVENGQCIRVLSGHTSLVGLLSITPNYLVSAAADATLRVWNPDTGELKHVFTSHTGAITSVALDDDKIISSSDGKLLLWSPRDGQAIRNIAMLPDEHNRATWQVALDGDRCVAASATTDDRTSSIDMWTFRDLDEEQQDGDGDVIVRGFVVIPRPSMHGTVDEA